MERLHAKAEVAMRIVPDRSNFQVSDLFIPILRSLRLPHSSAKARTSPKSLNLTVDPVIMMMTSPPLPLLLCAHHSETMAANEHIFSAPVRPPVRLGSRTTDDSPYFRPFELCQQQTKSAPLASSPTPHSTMIVRRPSPPPIRPRPSSWPWPWQLHRTLHFSVIIGHGWMEM